MTHNEYLAYSGARFVRFHPDDTSIVLQTNITGKYELWKYRNTSPPHQLTTNTRHFLFDYLFLEDEIILYAAAEDGGEQYHLFVLDSIKGSIERTADNVKGNFIPAIYSNNHPTGWKIIVETDIFDELMQVAELDIHTGKLRQLSQTQYGVLDTLVSPLQNYVVTREYHLSTQTRLHIIEIASGSIVQTIDHKASTSFDCWDHNELGFYYRSDHNNGSLQTYYYDMSTKMSQLLHLESNSQIDHLLVSHDQRFLIYYVNELGYSHLKIKDTGTDTTNSISEFSSGVGYLYDINPKNEVVLKYENPSTPPEIYKFKIEEIILKSEEQLYNKREKYRVTSLTRDMRENLEFVHPELISTISQDGLISYHWQYRPENTQEKLPVVIYVHGGPSGQTKAEYSGLNQILCQQGIAVIDTNIRGSSGFGKEFEEAINGNWGSAILDIKGILQYLILQDWVDEHRIGIYGDSFGGYVSLLAAATLSTLAYAISNAGVVDLIRFVQTVPQSWRETMTDWVGDPEESKEDLVQSSPSNYIESYGIPLLIIQGAEDIRVKKEVVDEFVNSLLMAGKDVIYHVIDEGHSTEHTATRRRTREIIIDFMLDQNSKSRDS